MKCNILTWDAIQSICILQQDRDKEGIYVPNISNDKPQLDFEYTSLQYIELANIYEVDGAPMSEKQKNTCKVYIESILPPIEWFKKDIINIPQKYLGSTDKWVIRKIETGADVPEGITNKRAQARQLHGVVTTANTLESIEKARVLILEVLGKCDSCGNSKI